MWVGICSVGLGSFEEGVGNVWGRCGEGVGKVWGRCGEGVGLNKYCQWFCLKASCQF